MPVTAHQNAWIARVLGVSPPQARPTPPPSEPTFQVFVKSVDGVTLTLRLPQGTATPLGTLRTLIEDRTGLSLGETMLMIGTKPLNAAHTDLPVAEYGLQPDQTLFLQSALKGGFGERAAIADAIMRGIQHGNVLGDIEASDGKSGGLTKFGRQILNKKLKINEDFRAAIYSKLSAARALPDQVASLGQLATWLNQRSAAVSAATSSQLGAGNCAEYANVTYSSLIANTNGQCVYRASMTDPYDHGFVITCPTDHGTDIGALYNDPDAMVADAWWASTICTFKSFVGGHNPYQEAVDLGNLKIRKRAPATGQPILPPAVETAIRDAVGDLAAARPELLTNLAQSAFDRRNGSGIFGVSGDIWNRTFIKDDRAREDVFRTFDSALGRGGIGQLEKDMAHVLPEEFFAYIGRDKETLAAVLASAQLGQYFVEKCHSISDQDFVTLCNLMTANDFAKYVLAEEDLSQKYLRGSSDEDDLMGGASLSAEDPLWDELFQ